MYLTVMNVYELCNKHQWFTCGTTTQYEKMFDYIREEKIKASDTYKIRKVAIMIWICSDEGFTEDDIYYELYKKALANKGVTCEEEIWTEKRK